ncbi:hypothetical protein SAMN05444358_101135 [Ruegeria halocynthiae]|uniref:Uncharacterized protein n=1 Tax=Ruegeria halocynthiae TaxID=985054 RepID=A0A1H2REJ2_9RHOB|nr:hypothetical protein [Ruegeria halocynthiae]SDW17801.1 hypothetical protein SAMN05444358_101135 [Ruegeria halocynthiae]
MNSKYSAMLVSGRKYSLRTPNGPRDDFIVFKHGVAVPVSAEIKRYLEKYAVDPVQTKFSTGEVEETYECKFTFEELDGDPAV